MQALVREERRRRRARNEELDMKSMSILHLPAQDSSATHILNDAYRRMQAVNR